MGILSTRSIAAPFIDKRNLITIVLVGVFFVVYRLSGGGVTTVPQGTKVPFTKPANSSKSASGLFFEDFNSSPAADLQKLRDNQNTGSAKSNDFLGNLMKRGNSNRQAPEPAPPTQPAQKLDDIERSLGLR